jgi:hypothetical protein
VYENVDPPSTDARLDLPTSYGCLGSTQCASAPRAISHRVEMVLDTDDFNRRSKRLGHAGFPFDVVIRSAGHGFVMLDLVAERISPASVSGQRYSIGPMR